MVLTTLLYWIIPVASIGETIQPDKRERILFNDGWLFKIS